MNYGPEACLDTAAIRLERIFNKVLDAGLDRVLTTHMRRSNGQHQFSSPSASGPSSPAPAPAAPHGNDRRRAGSEFSHLGYFEEYMDITGGRARQLGVLQYPLELPPTQEGRTLGAYGRRQFTITEDITLIKGHRTVVYKASPRRPLLVATMLQKLEGR